MALGPLTDTCSFKRPALRKSCHRAEGKRAVRACGPLPEPPLPRCPVTSRGAESREWEGRDCHVTSRWAESREPEGHGGGFACTKAGYLGTHRPSMLRNRLLVLAKLGESKFKHCEPPPDRVYGVVLNKGASQFRGLAHHNWDCVEGGSKGCLKKEKEKEREDFIALNRASVSAGVVTLGEARAYRTTHRVTVRPPVTHRAELPDLVHGDPSGCGSRRDSTSDVITSRPLQEWITCVKARQRPNLPSKQLTHKNLARRSETRAYQLRMSVCAPRVEPADRQLWHIPRFTRVKPRLSTFRNDCDLQASMQTRQPGDSHVLGDVTGQRLAVKDANSRSLYPAATDCCIGGPNPPTAPGPMAY